MSKLYTAKELEEMIKQGQSLASISENSKLTPMARDVLRNWKKNNPGAAASGSASGGSSVNISDPVLPSAVYDWKPGSDPKTAAELEKFFYSPEIHALKVRMCKIGERIWGKGYSDGNGGNITIRVGDNMVLCTPTLISKGFMAPEDICMVDLDGNQLAGTRPSSSEVRTHLGIIRREPKAKSCVHAHPIYATAFAVAGVTPPTCLIPEPEVFLGEVGLAPYQTPGTDEVAREVGEMAKKHQSILMQNHGLICWGNDVEDAYWKMEITEALCQTFYVAQQLGSGPQKYGPDKLKDLIQIRKKMGMPDHRLDELKECELCDASETTVNTAPQPADCGCGPASASAGDVDEALVDKITEMIMAKLK